MNALRPGEITRMKDTQADAMGDLFIIGRLTETVDSAGGLDETYVDSTPYPGSFGAPTSKAEWREDQVFARADMVLRTEQALLIGDRITVVVRNQTPQLSETLYVSGEARVFSTGLVYPLSRIKP